MSEEDTDLYYDAISTGYKETPTLADSFVGKTTETGLQRELNLNSTQNDNAIETTELLAETAELSEKRTKVESSPANCLHGTTTGQTKNKVLANIAKFEANAKDTVPIRTSPTPVNANEFIHTEQGREKTDDNVDEANGNEVHTREVEVPNKSREQERLVSVDRADDAEEVGSLISMAGAQNDNSGWKNWDAVNTEITRKQPDNSSAILSSPRKETVATAMNSQENMYSVAKPFPDNNTVEASGPNQSMSDDEHMTTVKGGNLVDSFGYSHARKTHDDDDVEKKPKLTTTQEKSKPLAENPEFRKELQAHIQAHQPQEEDVPVVREEDVPVVREEFEQTIYDSVCNSDSSGRTLDRSNDFEIVHNKKTAGTTEKGHSQRKGHMKKFGEYNWSRKQAKVKSRTMKRCTGHPFTGHHEFKDPHKGAVPELDEEEGLMEALSPFNFSSDSSRSSFFSDSSFDSPISDYSDENENVTKWSYNDKPLPPEPSKKTSDSLGEEGAMMLQRVKLKRKREAPSLPGAPEGLTSSQMKLRGVLQSLIDNERNYIGSLQRIVDDYKGPILKDYIPKSKEVKVTFAKIADILSTHTMFEIELAEKLRKWNEEERIGSIFHKFSNIMVIDFYSTYVNSFDTTCDILKETENSSKAFKEFLKKKQMESADRLSLPGLMLKPVQRFPQLIMIIKDLLKYTPRDHHDREPLQEGLTCLENVAHQLNERKRQSEQYNHGQQIISKLPPRVHLEKNVYLIRQDDMDQLSQEGSGGHTTTKQRRLFLMNDKIISVHINQRDQDGANSDRFTYKWHQSLKELELTTSAITPNMQTRVHAEPKNTTIFSPKSESTKDEDPYHVASDLTDMMHDLTVLAQISQLVSTLKLQYQALTEEHIQEMITGLQKDIQGKDYQLQLLNSSSIILQDKVRKKKYVFSATSASMKQEWCIDFLLAKYSLDIVNIPSWHQPDMKETNVHQPALLTKHMSIDMQRNFTKVKCAVRVYFPTRNDGSVEHLWVCSSTESLGQVSVVSLHTAKPNLVESFQVTRCEIVCVESVPGFALVSDELAFQEDSVWMSTVDSEILVFMFNEQKSDSHRQHIQKFHPGCTVISMLYVDDKVFCGSRAGLVIVYSRNDDGVWQPPTQILLGRSLVSSIICVSDTLWAACGNQIYVIDPETCSVQEKIDHSEDPDIHVQFLVKAGVGVWASFHGKSDIRLYHSESKRMLEDRSICKAINEFITVYTGEKTTSRNYEVTSLMASLGLLWVGTNLGIILTYTLPRLRDGVPRIHGSPQVALHGHNGPIRFLVPVHYGPVNAVPIRRRPSSILKRNNVDRSRVSKLPKLEERDSIDQENVYVSLDAEAMVNDGVYESVNYGWREMKGVAAGRSENDSKKKGSGCQSDSRESGEHKYYVIWPETKKFVPVDSLSKDSEFTHSDEHKYFILEPTTKQFVPVDVPAQTDLGDNLQKTPVNKTSEKQVSSQESKLETMQFDSRGLKEDDKPSEVTLRPSSTRSSGDRPYSVDHLTDLRDSFEGVSVRENPGRQSSRPKTFHNELDERVQKPQKVVDPVPLIKHGMPQQPVMPHAFRSELKNKLKMRKSQENLTDLAVTKDGMGRLYETLMRPDRNDLCSSLPSNYSSSFESHYVRPRTTIAISTKKPDITATRFASQRKQDSKKDVREKASACASKRNSTSGTSPVIQSKTSIGSSFTGGGTVDTLRKQNSNTILVLSGGDGYKDWKKRQCLQNYRPQESCLIFWMYRL